METIGVTFEDLNDAEMRALAEGRVFRVRMPASDPNAYWRNVVVPAAVVVRGATAESVAAVVRTLAQKWHVAPDAEVQALVHEQTLIQRVCDTYEVLPYELFALSKATGQLPEAMGYIAKACQECGGDASSQEILSAAYELAGR